MPERAGFVAVVGPSGAGKDTLLSLAAKALGGRPGILFARRVVTRQAQAVAEDHDSLDGPGFARAEAAGAFCLSWEAHGLRYGLPLALAEKEAAGCLVVANVSRRTLAPAFARFSRLSVIEITAPHELLVARIAARGRETPEEIERRLSRQVALELPDARCAHHVIENAGTPQAAAQRLAALLIELAESTT